MLGLKPWGRKAGYERRPREGEYVLEQGKAGGISAYSKREQKERLGGGEGRIISQKDVA